MEETRGIRKIIVRSHPKGEFLGTMVGGQFILDKRSRLRLEEENIRRCKEFTAQTSGDTLHVNDKDKARPDG